MALPGAARLKIHLHGLLDTGANVMILPLVAWPSGWPLDLVNELGAGLGGDMQSYGSQRSVVVSNKGDKSVAIRPLVASIRAALWGMDVLSLWQSHGEADFQWGPL